MLQITDISRGRSSKRIEFDAVVERSRRERLSDPQTAARFDPVRGRHLASWEAPLPTPRDIAEDEEDSATPCTPGQDAVVLAVMFFTVGVVATALSVLVYAIWTQVL